MTEAQWRLHNGYVVRTPRGKRVMQHVEMAARALGRPIPAGAEVHHVNSIRHDNRPENLVICQDAAYHHLLHRRTRALDGCGHADWEKCKFCKRWDSPKNLLHHGKTPMTNTYHAACAAAYVASRRLKRAA